LGTFSKTSKVIELQIDNTGEVEYVQLNNIEEQLRDLMGVDDETPDTPTKATVVDEALAVKTRKRKHGESADWPKISNWSSSSDGSRSRRRDLKIDAEKVRASGEKRQGEKGDDFDRRSEVKARTRQSSFWGSLDYWFRDVGP